MGPYVVLDLETTGLDARRDAIIQIALRDHEGRTYASFVNPERPVGQAIRDLTGFRDVDFEKAPRFMEIIPDIVQFIGEARIVGHNIHFDLGFLAQFGLTFPEPVDTLEWSRLAFPLRSHHALSDWYPSEGLHDARTDVTYTEMLLKRIGQEVESFSIPLKRDLEMFLGDEWRWWGVTMNQGSATPSALYRPGPDLFHAEPLDTVALEGSPLDWLQSGGQLSERVEGFEVRDGQLKMADAVGEAFDSDHILLVQAGTGTGKSLAYLTPAIFKAMADGERVVVATHTVALQEQLWFKDLPQAVQNLALKAALVKGRGRYLCLYKAQEVIQTSAVIGESRARRWALSQLLTYMELTAIGDVEEFPNKTEEGRRLWNEVMADSQACAGPRCPYAGPCFMRSARHQAEESHLVVVNHALLAAHLVSGTVLPEFSHLVVDEAHHFGEVLERALGFEGNIDQWTRRYRESMHPRTGMFARLSVHPEMLGMVATVQMRYRSVDDDLQELSQRLVGVTPPGEYDRRQVRLDQDMAMLMEEEGIAEKLVVLHRGFEALTDTTELLWKDAEERMVGIDSPGWLRYRQWQQEMVNFAMGFTLWKALSPERVSWWEVYSGRQGESFVTLRWAPVDIAQLVQDGLWSQVKSAVLTSATLSVGNRFDFVSDPLGVPKERLRSLIVGSPFDFRRQARLIVPTDSPMPQDVGYLDALATLVVEASRLRRGHTLVLLTSYRAVQGLSWRIRERLEAHNIRTLAQGVDGPGRRLVEEFMRQSQSVLIGTLTFWEGVDIPGSDLEVVIMGRLPFRAPGDPLEEAKHERIRDRGESPFYRRSIPDAVLRFRQGFGRLIRTTTDRGVVIVFDPRIRPDQSRYGKTFLAALPGVPQIFGEQQEVIDAMKEFWGASDANID